MKSISELKNSHFGEDVYVIGSGSSIDFIDWSFFDRKTCVGINKVPAFIKCDYGITHHQECVRIILGSDTPLVVSQFRHCMSGVCMSRYTKDNDCYMYEHVYQPGKTLVTDMFNSTTGLVVGSTTVIDAMSFAYHIGAKNIILCGIDGVTINGNNNFAGYYPSEGDDNYREGIHLNKQKEHSVAKMKIIEEFAAFIRENGVNVLSVNPFVNMRFEGHKIN